MAEDISRRDVLKGGAALTWGAMVGGGEASAERVVRSIADPHIDEITFPITAKIPTLTEKQQDEWANWIRTTLVNMDGFKRETSAAFSERDEGRFARAKIVYEGGDLAGIKKGIPNVRQVEAVLFVSGKTSNLDVHITIAVDNPKGGKDYKVLYAFADFEYRK